MSEAVKNLIIKGREVVEDDWQVLRLAEPVEGAPQIDPATVAVPAGKVDRAAEACGWRSATRWPRAPPPARSASGSPATSVRRRSRRTCRKFAVIAVDFPKFTDGRGYSIAYNLRAPPRLHRRTARHRRRAARPAVLRCSASASTPIATRPDRSIHDALKGLTDFSETYQASVDQKLAAVPPPRARPPRASQRRRRRHLKLTGVRHERPDQADCRHAAPRWRASPAIFRRRSSPPAWRRKTWC